MARFFLCIVVCWIVSCAPVCAASSPKVLLGKIPDGGIQPQVALDKKGNLHMIYFKGEASKGDLFYVKKSAGSANFTSPMRVNDIPASAVARACISSAQMAVGRDGAIYVLWNSSSVNKDPDRVVYFSKLDKSGRNFDHQENILPPGLIIDGSGSVGADSHGRVYVLFHAWKDGGSEPDGRVFLRVSKDDGKSFGAERAIDQNRGTCACCSMKAFVDERGQIYVMYRAAANSTERDTMLLSSSDYGKSFSSRVLEPWNANACPMTMFSFAQSKQGVYASWESPGTVNVAPIQASSQKDKIQLGAHSKYPAIAINRDGFMLVSWIEKSGWNKQGVVSWELLDAAGKKIESQSESLKPNLWAFSSAVPNANGDFELYF